MYFLLLLQQAEEAAAAENKQHKAWQKQAKGKKKGKAKKAKAAFQWKKPVTTVGAKSEHENPTEAAGGSEEVGYKYLFIYIH